MIDVVETDLLILGAGGAGPCAALRAADASLRLSVTVERLSRVTPPRGMRPPWADRRRSSGPP